MSLRNLSAALSVLFCSLPAAPARQQTTPATHTFQVNSRLVVTDVVVRSGSHDTVNGLKLANFHLTENGVPQQLLSVEEHTSAPVASNFKPSLPPNVYTNYRAQGAGGSSIILLDALNTPQKDQIYVRKQLLAFLKDVPPNTSFAVFALGSQLRLLQPFTTDPAQLLAAINSKRASAVGSSYLADAATGPNLSDVASGAEADVAANQANGAGAGGTAQAASANLSGEALPPELLANLQNFEAEQDLYNYDMRVRLTTAALTQIADYVRNQPGRKNLIWVSGSFPASILPNASLGSSGFVASANSGSLIERTTTLLTEARISVYPIDARGLMTSPLYDASRQPASPYVSVQSRNPHAVETQFAASQAADHAAMSAVAEQTGGRAFFNTNGIKEAMFAASTESSHYYTLTYTPTNKDYDGKLRHVFVKVTPGNYQLNYRKSYFATDPNAPRKHDDLAAADPLHAAFEAGAPDTADILFDVGINPRPISAGSAPAGKLGPEWKGPVTRYAVDFAVEGKDVHPQLMDDGSPNSKYRMDLEFVSIAYDEFGREVNAVSQHVTADLTPDQATRIQKQGVPFHQEIDLPATMVFLRVGVAEEASGRSGTLEVPITPEKQKHK